MSQHVIPSQSHLPLQLSLIDDGSHVDLDSRAVQTHGPLGGGGASLKNLLYRLPCMQDPLQLLPNHLHALLPWTAHTPLQVSIDKLLHVLHFAFTVATKSWHFLSSPKMHTPFDVVKPGSTQ